jgi:mono/diheme cytochrome c family protein
MRNLKNLKVQIFIFSVGLLLIVGTWFYTNSPLPASNGKGISLFFNQNNVVSSGKKVYGQNCASCHGLNLEGAPNWRQRDEDGYLPAPPHDQSGHTWHHSADYLFKITKFGIEKMIGEKYPNNMPAFGRILNDDDIIAALSYIKSTWPNTIQRRHTQLNTRANMSQK